MPDPEDEAIARVFHALGDRTRRAMVERLRAGPASVSQLAEPLGITLTAITQHLKVLEEAKLASTHKSGRVRTCRLETAGFARLEAWARARRNEWELRLDRLGEVLEGK
jgi:DNA-binding transcriptional ArsR family regulator